MGIPQDRKDEEEERAGRISGEKGKIRMGPVSHPGSFDLVVQPVTTGVPHSGQNFMPPGTSWPSGHLRN